MSHMQGKPPGAAPGPPLPTQGERKKWENTKSLPNSGKLCGQHHSLALLPCSPPHKCAREEKRIRIGGSRLRSHGNRQGEVPSTCICWHRRECWLCSSPRNDPKGFKVVIISIPPSTEGERGTHMEFQGLQLITLLLAHQHSQFVLFFLHHIPQLILGVFLFSHSMTKCSGRYMPSCKSKMLEIGAIWEGFFGI